MTAPAIGRPARIGRALPRGLVLGAVAAIASGCVTVAPGPVATPTPLSTPVVTAGPPTPTPVPTTTTYVVRSGDNLNSIAQRYGLTVGQLLAANPEISDPNRIRVGQVIVIPPPDAPDTGPSEASLGDASQDVLDRDGQIISTQGYADLGSFSASLANDRRLLISLQLVNAPPPRMDPEYEILRLVVVIDVDGDGQPDFRLLYANDIDGEEGFSWSLEDRRTGEIRSGSSFPGSVTAEGRRITFSVRRAALGAPRAYRMAALVERVYSPGGSTDPSPEYGVDHAPDHQWPRPNPRWLEVGGV
ncbi:MAG: LysM peptidoglycan-binding domain-containing protein [Chloroflexi bacterium]|nr:LysM peptidoglycan-binding domain-containing protein [Chloroflexota bacterium]